MTIFLVIGMSMAILSAIFWCIEGSPLVNNIQNLKNLDTGYQCKSAVKRILRSSRYLTEFAKAILSGWALAVDIFVTVWLTGAFSMSGVTGAIIGLSISNVISLFLIIKQRRFI